MQRLRLQFYQCPGDTLVATGAVECLMSQHPGKYLLDIEGTDAEAIFENNPHRTRLIGEAQAIKMENPLISECDKRPVHFLESYTQHLADTLGIDLKCNVNRPYLYLSDAEKNWISQVQEITGKNTRYWLMCSGAKKDYTIKAWGNDNYQAVIDQLKGSVQFVQVGLTEHGHKPLNGVIDLRGKTDTRQLIRLAYNAQGGIGGESFLHHLFAALGKPFVCIASGFLPTTWIRYPSTTVLNKAQMMSCGAERGCCWKSRTVKLEDGDPKDSSLCLRPVFGGSEPLPKCMALIKPEEVVSAIRCYYEGGVCLY